jgi:hypothetical protein
VDFIAFLVEKFIFVAGNCVCSLEVVSLQFRCPSCWYIPLSASFKIVWIWGLTDDNPQPLWSFRGASASKSDVPTPLSAFDLLEETFHSLCGWRVSIIKVQPFENSAEFSLHALSDYRYLGGDGLLPLTSCDRNGFAWECGELELWTFLVSNGELVNY